MDGSSPIQAYLAGDIGEGELLTDVDRVLTDGSVLARTVLLNDWRTKSGRIRASAIREQLDARLQAFTSMSGGHDTGNAEASGGPGRTLKPGDVLAQRFVIQEIIGSGGMGTVFKARDLRRDEAQDRHPYVAVKTLNIDVLRREDSLKILQREARKAQNLSHPNIVRVYDFDRDDETLFLTMELLEGSSLEAMIQANGLAGTRLQDALPILEQVASALEFAHSEGIVHSDLKPANILILGTGRVKVIDFGIARAIPTSGMQTVDRTTFDVQALGALTPAYASPEMIEGKDPDPRDDVFALACITYELLTGSHPFGRTPASAARAGNLKPRRPARLSPGEWRALQGGLEFDRSRRNASPKSLIAAMRMKPPIWQSRRFATRASAGVVGIGILIGLWAYSADVRRIVTPLWVGTAVQSGAKPLEQHTLQGPDRQQLDQAAADQLARQQADDEAAKALAQKQAAEDEAKRIAQRQADEEAARRLAQQQADEEAAKMLAQKQADEATALRLAQQQADEAAKQSAQQQQAGAPGPVDIAELQRSLNAIGLNTGSSDGKSGARTQEMVRAFQSIIGEPQTGEATPALLDSLHKARPSAEAKAKSLFSLAAAANRSRRSGDAIRLYESGLTFVPANADALLVLGDLYRDRNDYDGARRLYELLQRNGGAAANVGRERLATLPRQQETPAKGIETGAPDAASTRPTSSGAVLPQTAARSEPGRLFDGTYVGSSQVSGSSSPNCVLGTVRLAVRNSRVSLGGGRQASVAVDGTFSGTKTLGLPPVVQFWTGKIVGDGIETEVRDPACTYHVSLKRVSP
jgi:serine/threonine protein kinase/peptidoglycan hydrolase-like protein with peptidoglycan-binding domain